MGVLLIMKLSSKFTFDYKYIINGFQHHNESVHKISQIIFDCNLNNIKLKIYAKNLKDPET